MLTLTIILDKQHEYVLMCYHEKQKMMNFIGGKSKELETPMAASYRELEEETGITKDDVELKFVRCEQVTTNANVMVLSNCWHMYVTVGIIDDTQVELKEEKNPLTWISIADLDTLIGRTTGYGNCYTYLREAFDTLGLEYK